ncbi:MAG TPA: membrane protein insertion efficiency factor YidD [Hellea balneolensis]|uniref:Putative membrane protein insertion efficiency factor n=1 Tax=Hellea balneolensis TaxID=287478 RepID=A0A7C5QR73_9PROT|nr:membrane protein insertion efficiency factor YidD [Hellea balneolensis]
MKNPLIYPALGLLKLYKWTLSPVFYALGIRCRHVPSCSEYGMEAFRTHGVWVGFWLTLSRLLRCHPWGSHGVDPVPKTVKKPPFWAPWRYGDWKWNERTAKGCCEHK